MARRLKLILSDMENHWTILRKRVIECDNSFKKITLAAVLRITTGGQERM